MKLKKLSLFCQVVMLSWILVPAPAIFAYDISGKVKTETGAVVPGVYVTLSGPVSKIIKTDANGNYKFRNLPNDSYIVTPSMVNYFFTPPGRNVIVNGANKPAQHLTGTATVQEKCLEAQFPEKEPFIVPLKVIRIANNIYSIVFSGDNNLVHGTAEVKDNKMLLSNVDSGWWHSNTNSYTVLTHCQIDLATQQGTCRQVVIDAWPSDGGDGGGSIQYEAGTASFVPCP